MCFDEAQLTLLHHLVRRRPAWRKLKKLCRSCRRSCSSRRSICHASIGPFSSSLFVLVVFRLLINKRDKHQLINFAHLFLLQVEASLNPWDLVVILATLLAFRDTNATLLDVARAVGALTSSWVPTAVLYRRRFPPIFADFSPFSPIRGPRGDEVSGVVELFFVPCSRQLNCVAYGVCGRPLSSFSGAMSSILVDFLREPCPRRHVRIRDHMLYGGRRRSSDQDERQ